ncbi:hypothetical protein ACHAWF_015282 [Thalassiosira exigua]
MDEKPQRDETAAALIPDPMRHPRMFYVMTLGTDREFRRCGLGSKLVENAMEMVERGGDGEDDDGDDNGDVGEGGKRGPCGAAYLHVITYNEGAMRMYERLGFDRVKVIKDYYSINHVNYDCYLYARYFHGNRGHKSKLDMLYDLTASVLRTIGRAIVSA